MVSTAFQRVSAPPPVDDARDEDVHLLEAVRAGDRAAEERLYRRHAPSIHRLATRLLRSTEEARDVVQDTFLEALQDLGALKDARAFRGWLHTICVRLVHRRFRRRKLLRLLGLDRTEEDAKLELLASPDADPEVRAELRIVDACLDTLPAEEKIAWTLRYVEGFALEEVAETCKCSLATAKRRIAGAAAALDRLHREQTP